MANAKIIKHNLGSLFSFGLIKIGQGLKYSKNIFLDGLAPKDRWFLRQVTYTKARSLMHGQAADLTLVKMDRAGIFTNQPANHVEAGRLAGTIGAEQTDNFATADF